jgi:RNA polymerase sigma-70 factor (ECF subfamily)
MELGAYVPGFAAEPITVEHLPPLNSGGSDTVLVAQAKAGDAQAFALLYRRYLDRIYDFTARRVENTEAAQDATQTVFLRALQSLSTCRDGDLFAGWLFAIARNVINDGYRARRYTNMTYETAFEYPDQADSPEEEAIRADQIRQFEEACRQCLTPDERELLDLRMQDLGDKEIARVTGRTHGAIRTAQYRLVRKLRDCLQRHYPGQERSHVDA